MIEQLQTAITSTQILDTLKGALKGKYILSCISKFKLPS